MIQDYILGIVGWVFLFALIPQIIKGFKVKRGLVTIPTSLLTGIGMLVISIAHFTLNLWFTAISEFSLAIAWFILLYQTVKYKTIDDNNINEAVSEINENYYCGICGKKLKKSNQDKCPHCNATIDNSIFDSEGDIIKIPTMEYLKKITKNTDKFYDNLKNGRRNR